MNNDKPILLYVGTGLPNIFMAALHEIIKESQLPIVIVQAEEPQSFSLSHTFHIPDIKIEDIIKQTTIEKQKHKHPRHYQQQKNYRQTYRNIRDIRATIKMKTHRKQRMKQ